MFLSRRRGALFVRSVVHRRRRRRRRLDGSRDPCAAQGRGWFCVQVAHAPPQGPRPVPRSRLWRAQRLPQGRRHRHRARPRPRRPARPRHLPQPHPLQAPEGALRRRRGHVHRTVHLLRPPRQPLHRQRPPARHAPRGHRRLQCRAARRRPRRPGEMLRRLRHRHQPQHRHRHHQGEAPVGVEEGSSERVPRHGGAGCRRRQDGEAAAQGGQRLPQVPGEEELLAQGARRGHEPRRPSPRRRKPPAHRPRLHRPQRRSSRRQDRTDCRQEDRKAQRPSRRRSHQAIHHAIIQDHACLLCSCSSITICLFCLFGVELAASLAIS